MKTAEFDHYRPTSSVAMLVVYIYRIESEEKMLIGAYADYAEYRKAYLEIDSAGVLISFSLIVSILVSVFLNLCLNIKG
jgi:hypothetical protein